MVPTWVLSAPDGPHVGPMNLANRAIIYTNNILYSNIVIYGLFMSYEKWDNVPTVVTNGCGLIRVLFC